MIWLYSDADPSTETFSIFHFFAAW